MADKEQDSETIVAAETKDGSKKEKTAKPRRPASSATKKNAQPAGKSTSKKEPRKPPLKRPYPRISLERALRVAKVIKEMNGGKPWPPNDVAKAFGFSPNNNDFFYVAAAARDFGLTDAGRDSKTIGLTDFGREVVYPASDSDEVAAIQRAFLNIDLFRKVLEHYNGPDLPDMQYLGNTLTREFGIAETLHHEFADLFKENCAFARITSTEKPGSIKPSVARSRREPAVRYNPTVDQDVVLLAEPDADTGLRCFIAMPFGEREETHAAGFFTEVLKNLIAPAGREAGFAVATARRDGSDVIQATIVNQLLDADLVIADLTENNPNVLFELGLRIAEDKPIALIRARGTRPIFDVDNLLRVLEYDPNLWQSTIEIDRPRLREHIRSAWEDRDNSFSYMKILRGKRA